MDGQHQPNFSPHRHDGDGTPGADDEFTTQPVSASQTRIDYLHKVMPPKKKRLWLRVFIIVVIILLLVAAGVVGYQQFVKSRAPAKTVTATTTSKTPSNSSAPAKVATEHFDSTNFNLGFDYPKGWTVADTGEGTLTVTSPASKGQTTAGAAMIQTVMTIAPSGKNLTSFDAANGLAIQDSDKISYTNPTSAQRANTYLTFVQYADTTVPGALDAVYITGDYGYQKGQAVPKVDMAKLDPVVAVTFMKCADASCQAKPVPTNVPVSLWEDPSFQKPILIMLKSLSFN